MNIYYLTSDIDVFGGLYERNEYVEDSLRSLAMAQHWTVFPESFQPYELELRTAMDDTLHPELDISSVVSPFMVFSEDAVHALRDILENSGQLIPVKTSLQRTFFGFYPTKACSCFDREHSEFTRYPNGLLIKKLFLSGALLPEEPLFVISESISSIFVNDHFRERVEQAGLKGFNWSLKVRISN